VEEIEVIRRTRSFLQANGLGGHRVLDLYTDAHPTLLRDPALQPFQRFTLAFDGFAAHPDLAGRLDDGETTFGVEAKGEDDLLRGIAQADLYRAGFHLALFASAGVPSPDLVAIARQRGVGVLAVTLDGVQVIDLPPAHLPRLRQAEGVRKQFAASNTISRQFVFNLPTHYLCFVPVLAEWVGLYGATPAALEALKPFTRKLYPVLPADFRAALAGAEKLGLVRVQGQQAQLTFVGRAAVTLLPDSATLADIHRQLATRGSGLTLASEHPPAGAVLRCLLYGDPVARFIIDVLADLGPKAPVPMPDLVRHAAERDRTLTPVVFFKPEAGHAITDDRGRILWEKVRPEHYRSTTFFQYKSVLKHAGVLAPHALGGPSARGYRPEGDVWELLAI
jgi:hypothetical protein